MLSDGNISRPSLTPVVPIIPSLSHIVCRPSGLQRRGQLLTSRHPSSNASEGNNRESSLDDSGVVDDHEDGDVTSEEVTQLPHAVVQRTSQAEPVTVALRAKEVRVIKCNGVSPSHGTKQQHMYTLPADYLSHIVVLGE